MIRHAPSIGLGIGLSLRGSGARFSGILDQYAGASAAYSLRALSSAWLAGDVVEVRRSSDSTTQSFTAGQVADGTLTAFCGVGDGFVSTWYDQSGNGNNATQATTTAQPKIVDAGALVTGGIDFDGVDDYLLVDPISVSQPVTAFISVAMIGANQEVLDSVSVSPDRILFDGNGTNYRLNAGTSIELAKPNDNTNILYWLANGASSELAVNGGLATTGDAGTKSGWTDGMTIGTSLSAAHLNGTITELIIYASDQSANRVAIETNINDHYSIY